ncbi:MAG: 50S ribosomal protein L28 [Anaerolineales bacterium]
MSRVCKLTGKRPNAANHVSHSQKKVKRKQYPNIQPRKIWVPELNKFVRVRVSTRAIKNIDKKGLMPYLEEQGLTLKDIT